MSDYIYFRTLSEKGDKFLHNRTGMAINLYFLASLSHGVQSCHVPQRTLNITQHELPQLLSHVCPPPAALAGMAMEIWLKSDPSS